CVEERLFLARGLHHVGDGADELSPSHGRLENCAEIDPAIEELVKLGFIRIDKGHIHLLEKGKSQAIGCVRRHRLAERLFADILALPEYEMDACRFEHAISPEVEEAICTFLGHPPTCPHNRPIPRGNCCKLYARKVTPLVASLADSHVGEEFRVVFLRTPMIDRLAGIGLVPGSVIKLIQKKPSYVIKVDETTIAVEEEVAKGIFVKKT
ncbi:MAG: metal-dependent transcriptional regulator, partial [Nitrospiraceae bacterium]|nr:metal-dependent transcriptional regulator [Nitrospiraceae bacterium]